MLARAAFIICLFLYLIPRPILAQAYKEVPLVEGRAVIPENQSGIFRITGQADWAKAVLLKPDDFPLEKREFIQFPKTWRHMPELPLQGQGTYHFSIDLPSSSLGQTWGLWFPRPMGATRIWVNDYEIPNPTILDAEKGIIEHKTNNLVFYFQVHHRQLTITIQNANTKLHTGGFDWDMLVAPASRLQNLISLLSLLDAAILGSLVFSAIYHIWLYSFRRQWLPYLILGLFFLVSTVRIGITGSGRLLQSFALSEVLIWKAEILTYYLMVLLSLFIIQLIYPEEVFKRWNRLLIGLGVFCSAFLIFTPLPIGYQLLSSFHYVALAVFGTMMQILILAMIRRRTGSFVFFLGMMAAIVCSMIDFLLVFGVIYLPFYTIGPGLMAFTLIACIFQSFRFEKIFQKLEIQTKSINRLNADLRRQAQALESQVQKRTLELEAILQNTDAGVLIFVEEGHSIAISPFQSRAAHEITQMVSIDWAFFRAFIERTNLSSEQVAQVVAAIEATLGGHSYFFDSNSELLPHEIKVPMPHGTMRTYICTWVPRIENELVKELLLILTDVSQELAQAQQSRVRNERLERIREIFSQDPSRLAVVMKECSSLLTKMRLSTNRIQSGQQNALVGFERDLHTLKGLARSFGLKGLSLKAHQAEDQLSASKAKGKLWDGQALSEIEMAFAAYRSDYEGIFHRSHSTQQERLDQAGDLLVERGLKLLPLGPDARWLHAWRLMLHQLYIPITQLTEPFQNSLSEIARQLGKPRPQLSWQGEALLLRRRLEGPLSGAFSHILRNSLDHGIEEVAIRVAQGKPREGHIQIECRLEDDLLKIAIQDDGRGLSLQAIRHRALQHRLLEETTPMTDEQLAELVFTSGFSTKDIATDISGRGVGMDAVRSTLEEWGGGVTILFTGERTPEGYRSCCWCLTLPRRYALREAAA